MSAAGNIVFQNLLVIFAVGVALGLANIDAFIIKNPSIAARPAVPFITFC
jgi:hypothetical protein